MSGLVACCGAGSQLLESGEEGFSTVSRTSRARVLRAQPSPVIPLAGFSLHENEAVFVETVTGEQRLDDPGEVAAYTRMFELLRDAATTGPDAVALVQRVAAELRD
ncbi:MAG TPA: Scr1 family TA system antitoxin-like transcriptional regulator [Pseudonocardiaceae bacterium]